MSQDHEAARFAWLCSRISLHTLPPPLEEVVKNGKFLLLRPRLVLSRRSENLIKRVIERVRWSDLLNLALPFFNRGSLKCSAAPA
jgi:hypothetical protein